LPASENFNFYVSCQKNGFTLIELLVVIAIIGLLASIIFASLNKTRMKARNSRRLSDMRQIQLALELYYDEKGQYPIDDNDGGGCGCDYSHLPSDNPDFIDVLEPDYMPKVPLDPTQDPTTPNLVYKYVSDDGSTYTLQFNMEPDGLGTNCPENAPNINNWCTLQP
jgi:type II secretion system protein G